MARTATLLVSGLLLVLVFVSRASGGPEPSSRSEYAALFNRLSAEGCQACVAAGYGWSDARGRCGGFASMKCASQEVGVSQVEDEGEDEDDWLEGIDEDDDEETGGLREGHRPDNVPVGCHLEWGRESAEDYCI